MNTFYKFIYGLTIIISLFGCKIEENEAFTSFDVNSAIQNEGYFPLAMDNNWVYENRLVIINDKGTPDKSDDFHEYSGSMIESEHPVSNVKFLEIEDTITKNKTKRIDYGFTPLGLGKVLGGFFGNFMQITKKGKDYYRKSIVKKESLDKSTGKLKTDYYYEIDSQKFLSDSIVGKNMLISTRTDTIGDGVKGIFIIYEVKSYVIEELPDGLPVNLRNQPGIDDHLAVYKNVLHTTDTIKIKRLENISDGGMRLRLNAEVVIPAGTSKLETRSVGPSQLTGNIWLYGTVLSIAPIWAVGGLLPPIYDCGGFVPPLNGCGPLISDLKLNLGVCEAKATIDIDEIMEGSRSTLVSEQPLYYIDHYWVKGVGNIKNITSPAKFNAVIDLTVDPAEPLSEPLEVFPTDPTCKDIPNTVELTMSMQSQPAVGNIVIPFTLESRSYVQNLRKVRLRTTNN